MRFGLFVTNPVPRPWDTATEQQAFDAALDHLAIADRVGFDHAWVVEQHFLEEYSHSSAPELFLAAASQRTSRIRLGHGGVLMPPAYNHPVRVAERLATLDVLSGGRVDWGIADSKSQLELEGFGVAVDERRAMTLEATAQVADMLALEPYPGFAGQYVAVPARNVVPKPVQRPHPPLWITCSDDATMHLAARLGIGVLAHGFFDPREAKRIVDDYYATFERECVPLGHAVNPNVAMVNPLYCHPDGDEALRVGAAAFGEFTFAVRHYYVFGRHRPGQTGVWQLASRVADAMGGPLPIRGSHAIGTPDQIVERLRAYQAVGVDQVILQHQPGRLTHQQVCASLELVGREVVPALTEGEHERQRQKAERLAPAVAAALARRPVVDGQAEVPVPVFDAYGRHRPNLERTDLANLPDHTRDLLLELQRLEAIASSFYD